MISWPTPSRPAIGTGHYPNGVQIWSSESLKKITTGSSERADLYVCGITPYDATHMGHAATYVAFDLLLRLWLDAGYPARYVQNVTDIDDPLLVRAAERGVSWESIAEKEIQLFREDMTALRVIPPMAYIGAVESIPLVVAAVEKLLASSHAYWVEKDVYFSVSSDPDFGTRSHLMHEEQLKIFGERGGDPDLKGKRAPLDCLLWRGKRDGEPFWESSLGAGRPGWHIECSAIALQYLGKSIDVQGGGSDLLFPHHDMGAAEAFALTGKRFAQNFVHAGMIGLDGEKMSKSKGNLVFVSKLREAGVDPNAIRLALMESHYRENRDWSDELLLRAQKRLQLWSTALAHSQGTSAEETIELIRQCLANDLDTPGALRAVDQWAHAQKDEGSVAGPGALSRALDSLLGIAI